MEYSRSRTGNDAVNADRLRTIKYGNNHIDRRAGNHAADSVCLSAGNAKAKS